MLRRLIPLFTLLLLTSSVQSVMASVIVPNDPVIGVRGRGGSIDSDSSAFFAMEGCPSDLNEFFGESRVFCLDYHIVQNVEAITSLTFQFTHNLGGIDTLIPNSLISNDNESGFNGFPTLQRLDDGFSVRLSFDSVDFLAFSSLDSSSSLQCPDGDGSVACAQGSHIQLYLTVPPSEGDPNPPYQASLRAINDVAVPEPGLLILMGLGLTFVGRRLRHRWTNSVIRR